VCSVSGARCGRISYTNDLPVYAAFDAGALEFPGTLHPGVPADLNRKLLAGELQISPVSSFFYAQHADELTLLPFVCIAAHGPVKSVCCISAHHPRDLEGTPVAVTRESATGRALFDVICRKHYGFAPDLRDSDEPFAMHRSSGAACLLIGDAAIEAALASPAEHVFDVGSLWHDLTGLGMVYAVWASRNDYAEQHADRIDLVVNALRDGLRWSETHAGQVISAAQALRPRPPGFYEEYYRALDFHFQTPAANGASRDDLREGMTAFFELAAGFGLLRTRPVAQHA